MWDGLPSYFPFFFFDAFFLRVLGLGLLGRLVRVGG